MATTTAQQFRLPDLGEGLTEAVIVDWKVALGEEVAIDQIVVEVESAKSVVELPVPYAGKVIELHGDIGSTIQLGQPLITIGTDGAGPDPAEATAQAAAGDALREEDAVSSEYSGAVLIGYGTKEDNVCLKRPVGGRFGGRRSQAPEPSSASQLIDPQRNSPVMSPLVRKLAKDAGFDARHLEGTGPKGLVVRADVERAIAQQGGDSAQQAAAPARTCETPAQQAPAFTPPPSEDRRTPVAGMRALVADHMSESHASVPKATIWLDVDATELLAAKRRLEERTREKFSLTTLVARFVVAGLKQYPLLNASFDAANREIVEHVSINLGLAAQTPRGLTVPVVHGAGEMTLRELRDGIAELVAEAPRGNYPPAKLTGGTFTLNNYGGFGVDGASPIINLPQSAMLGLGRLKERAWVVNHELAVRTVMTVSFVFDHRVCDGDTASGFLGFVASCIEEPLLLLTEV